MAIYDDLPKPVRQALADAALGAGTQVLVMVRNQVGDVDHSALAENVRSQAQRASAQQQREILFDLERNPIKWKMPRS